MRTRPLARSFAVLFAVAMSGAPRPALAWDPTVTHQQLTERALLESQTHVRWMEQSAMQRGLFTPLRLDPARLPPALRRQIFLAVENAPAAAGAVPLGGPGACPPAGSPASTRERCVDGDLWETDALGWIRLGLVVEATPSTRLFHHFANLDDPAAQQWQAYGMSRLQARKAARVMGEPLASRINGTAFDGTARSAVAWLEDVDSDWGPHATAKHLQAASFAATAAEREHHLALGLIGVGALLHVVQNLAVPAHARGDLLAFWQPLSSQWGDRGLPMEEYVRTRLGGLTLPQAVVLRPREGEQSEEPGAPVDLYEAPVAPTLRAVLLGAGQWPGLIPFAAQRFLSAGTLPEEPIVLPENLSATDAAERLLADVPGLLEEERAGATLSPWPAAAGYVQNAAGRPLAAFEQVQDGRVRIYLDTRVYRDAASHLLPRALVASASAVDLVLSAFPTWTWDPQRGAVHLEVPADLESPYVTLLSEDAEQRRRALRRIVLTPGARNRIDRVTVSGDERIVMVLEATRGGVPIVSEQALSKPAAAEPAQAVPRVAPPTTRETTTAPPAGEATESAEANAPASPTAPVDPNSPADPNAPVDSTPPADPNTTVEPAPENADGPAVKAPREDGTDTPAEQAPPSETT